MLCLQALEMFSYSCCSSLCSILFLGCFPRRNDFAFCAAPASFWVILQSLRKVFRADMKIKIQGWKGRRGGGLRNVGSLRCTVVWKNWQNKRNYLQTSLDRIRKCYGQTLLSACVWIFQKNLADDSKGKRTSRLPWYGYNSSNNNKSNNSDFWNYCKCH